MIALILIFLLTAVAVAYGVTAWEEYGEYGPSAQWWYEMRMCATSLAGVAVLWLVIVL